MRIKVAYLGPEGTYAEQAAHQLTRLEKISNPELVPCNGLESVVEHLANGSCDAAVVPIENSVEGGVTATLDALWSHQKVFIKRAIVLPIRHCLIGSGSIHEISEILSHPQALAQCSKWLSENLPNALQLPTSSTAEAVRMVEKSKFRGAIASQSAANSDGLHEIAFPINDVAGNRTRFLLLKPKNDQQQGDIASLAFSLHRNSPGALIEALSCIAQIGLNMSRIESRPSKRELGEYVFFIDVELTKDINAESSYILEKKLKPLCENIFHFGCYPSSEIKCN